MTYRIAARSWLAVAQQCLERAAQCYELGEDAMRAAAARERAGLLEEKRAELRIEQMIVERLTRERGA